MADIVDVNKTIDELQSRLKNCSTAKEDALTRIAAEPQTHSFLSRWLLSSQITQIQDINRKAAKDEEKLCAASAVRTAKELIAVQRDYDASLAAPNKLVEQSQARTINIQSGTIKVITGQRDFLAYTLEKLLEPHPTEPPKPKNHLMYTANSRGKR
jgi:hypothetical protein